MGVRRVFGMLSVIVLLAVGAPTTAEAASTAPQPVVSGNALIDARSGVAWQPHAVNWPSFEYACQQGWAYSSSGATAAAAQAMASWGINAVRVPLNEACWLGVEGSPAYGTKTGYRAAINSWVSTLNAAGLVVILDLHWSSPTGRAADGQMAMPDSRSVTFWSQVGAAYAGNASVMFDAFNEPYSRWNSATESWAFSLTWTCWRDGGCAAPVENDAINSLSGSTYTTVGMTSLVSVIRAAGALQPILLGGLDYSNDLRQWLAYRPADTQLVASWHNYPGQRCHTETCWNAEIAPVAAVVPVIASEFGQTDGSSGFLTTFMNWADTHGVGYAPWAWWIVPSAESLSGSRYALIADDAFTPQAPSGTAFHDHLAGLSTLGPFADVAPGQPFFDDIAWMRSSALSVGYPNGALRPTYRPLESVTRQAMAAFLYRMAGAGFVAPITPSFVDVPTTHPFYTAIEWMRFSGISAGYADAGGLAFHPDEPVSRQAMAAFLFRLEAPGGYLPPATPSFTDVVAEQLFSTEIEWMRASGVSQGYADPGGLSYHPTEPVTRQAMAAFLHRFSMLG